MMAWLAAIPVIFALVLTMEKFERHMLSSDDLPGRRSGRHRTEGS
ncbi:hypothetical protein [Spirillospora sp. NPDC047279]